MWNDGTSNDLYGALVDQDGTVLTPGGGFPISTGADYQFSPTIAWNGTNFLVAWIDSVRR